MGGRYLSRAIMLTVDAYGILAVASDKAVVVLTIVHRDLSGVWGEAGVPGKQTRKGANQPIRYWQAMEGDRHGLAGPGGDRH